MLTIRDHRTAAVIAETYHYCSVFSIGRNAHPMIVQVPVCTLRDGEKEAFVASGLHIFGVGTQCAHHGAQLLLYTRMWQYPYV